MQKNILIVAASSLDNGDTLLPANHFYAGELKRIHKLKYWSLPDVLHEKYNFSPEDSREIADFLLPMLAIVPIQRASARTMLSHPWLSDA
jgi:serine/threonine protein kinase